MINYFLSFMIEHDLIFDEKFTYNTPDGSFICYFTREFGNIKLVSYTKTIGEGQWIVEDLMNGRGYIQKGAIYDK